jgi:hypothetical protein
VASVIGLDAGSDTFARYRYQAEVILPYCLNAALGDEIIAVIPEHLEDVAIEMHGRWRFIQIKSRDPEVGLWALRQLLVKPGGALRSLYRTHLLTRDHLCSLEIVLEGAPRPRDPIQSLKPDADRNDPALVAQVQRGLRISASQAREFLARVVLAQPQTRAVVTKIRPRVLRPCTTTSGSGSRLADSAS